MTVEPDPREVVYYDIQSMIMQPMDIHPNYWSNLFNKFKLIDDSISRPICKTCNNCDELLEFNNKIFCLNDYEPILNVEENKVLGVKKKCLNDDDHIIVFETVMQTIKRLLNDLFEFLEEPSGNRLDLFSLECYLWGREEDDVFETRLNGDVTKNEVRRRLYVLKAILLSRLMALSENVRFGSQLRTPSVVLK